ncbi:uncharacterized protein [Ptychodera flava]|uniref:uncharacterized protein n=1 Tax=Ptychodera flava TaxID=63121 RepID=UPI00396A631B
MAEIKRSKKEMKDSMLAYSGRMREISKKKGIKKIPSVLSPKLVPDDSFQVSFSLGSMTMPNPDDLSPSEEQSLTIEPLYKSEITTRPIRSRSSARLHRRGSFLPNIHQGSTYSSVNSYNMSDMYSTMKTTGFGMGNSSSQVEIVDILPYPDFTVAESANSETRSISPQDMPMIRNQGMHKKNFYARKKRPPTPPKIKVKPQKKKRSNKPSKGKRRGGKNGADDPRKFPIKKQFIWSELMDQELKSYIPPRLPGSKLKPNYKRTNSGEIYIPDGPIEIELERLVTLNMDSPTEKQLSGAYAEEIKALMERNAKRRAEAKAARKKAKKKVKFVFPPGYTDSESSSSDEEYTDVESADMNNNTDNAKESQSSENMVESGETDNDDGSRRLHNDDIVITSVQDSFSPPPRSEERPQSPSSVILEITKAGGNKGSTTLPLITQNVNS